MRKRLFTISLLVLSIAGVFGVLLAPVPANALPQPPMIVAMDGIQCKPGEHHPKNPKGQEDKFTCCPSSAGPDPTPTECFMARYGNPLINLLAALVGIVVLASVIFGSIQYASSAGDSGKAAAAKQRIINSLVALAAFVFLFAFLQWVIPGGI